MTATSIDREIVGLERSYWEAMKGSDKQALQRLTDDNCIIAGAQGVSQIPKRDFIPMMEEGMKQYRLRDFKLDDSSMKVRQLGNDVVTVGYKVHEDLTVENKPVQFDAFETSVWVRRNGNWTCALHTESIQGDAYGRDRRTSN